MVMQDVYNLGVVHNMCLLNHLRWPDSMHLVGLTVSRCIPFQLRKCFELVIWSLSLLFLLLFHSGVAGVWLWGFLGHSFSFLIFPLVSLHFVSCSAFWACPFHLYFTFHGLLDHQFQASCFCLHGCNDSFLMLQSLSLFLLTFQREESSDLRPYVMEHRLQMLFSLGRGNRC